MKRVAFVLSMIVTACAGPPMRIDIPKTRTEGIVDVLHGTSVPDPYRWLEDDQSPEVQKWADDQHGRTRKYLDERPGHGAVRGRLTELASIGRLMAPRITGRRVFYLRREGEQNHALLLMRDGFKASPKVVIDPNRLSRDGTTALDWWHPSRDGSLLAYGLSQSGSEISTLHVRTIDSGKDLPDVIPYTRACDVAWLKDNSGFYYTRYPEPGSVPKGEEAYHRRVYFHKLGVDPRNDPLLFGEGRDKEDWPSVSLSPDDRYLVVSVFQGWSKSELYVQDREKPGPWIPLVEGRDALFIGTAFQDRFYVLTNDGASRYRIMAADAAKPEREHWQELVPEGEATLESFEIVSGKLVLRELHQASTQLRVLSLDGCFEQDIPLPALGSVSVVSGDPEGEDLAFDFQSFFIVPTLYRMSLRENNLEAFETLKETFDWSEMEVRQVWYSSKDGTRISMFLVHRKDLRRNGGNPVLLNGYGGFSINQTPWFSAGIYLWIERGGVYALPNLRGGGEYGESWHRAGMLDKKQNVFDDFIAAAEWLIREGYTNSRKLAMSGGSNGGLLVGAAVTQRPDLFQAMICSVPLLDMVRYHKFLIARLWIPEYGSPDEPDAFHWLYAYSPYHRLRDGVPYPATLFMTADTDTRVAPLHARKMAARLQAVTSSDRPVLLRVEKKAGHGAGKPLSKVIEEMADQYAFLFWQLGMEP